MPTASILTSDASPPLSRRPSLTAKTAFKFNCKKLLVRFPGIPESTGLNYPGNTERYPPLFGHGDHLFAAILNY